MDDTAKVLVALIVAILVAITGALIYHYSDTEARVAAFQQCIAASKEPCECHVLMENNWQAEACFEGTDTLSRATGDPMTPAANNPERPVVARSATTEVNP